VAVLKKCFPHKSTGERGELIFITPIKKKRKGINMNELTPCGKKEQE